MSEKDPLQGYLDSCRLVTARLVDSITRSSQMASSRTPEMEELFCQWRDLIAREILTHSTDGRLEVDRVAEAIGISPSTVLSLFLALHRAGEVTISSVQFRKGPGMNREICDCLRENSEQIEGEGPDNDGY